MRWCIPLLFLLAACSSLTSTGIADSDELIVASYETVDPEPMNSKVESAVLNGEAWPSRPDLMAATLLGGDDECQYYSLKEKKNKAENPDKVVIILVRDGFLDDSVRGDWHRLILKRAQDSTWRVHKLDRAWRCWRSERDAYQGEACP